VLQVWLLLGLMLVPLLASAAVAQQATNELWPELDVYWTPAKHQRTVLELSGSSEREAAKKEATVGLYQDYLQLPRGYLRAGYRFTFSTRDASYRESRIVGEATRHHSAHRFRHSGRLRGRDEGGARVARAARCRGRHHARRRTA
jgi:hypothetical protein